MSRRPRGRLAALLVVTLPSVVAAVVAVYAFQAWIFLSDDRRSKLEVILEERAAGRPAYTAFGDWIDVFPTMGEGLATSAGPRLPLSGIPGARSVLCREPGREAIDWVVYDSDERGFRNPAGQWSQPVDLMLLGDSFTHGFCVPDGDDLASLIRRAHPGTLNLGIHGNGPLLELATLREYGPVARPRQVLWLYYSNDLADMARERKNPAIVAMAAQAQGVAALGDEMAGALRAYHDETLHKVPDVAARRNAGPIDFLLLRNLRERLGIRLVDMAGGPPPRPETATPAELAAVVADAARTAAAQDAGFVFVYLPGYLEAVAHDPQALEIHDQVIKAVTALGIPVVDLLPAFAATGAPETLFQCRRCHYGRAGYRLVAQVLEQSGLLPTNRR